MDYRLQKQEPFIAGCQRIACEEIAAVLQALHVCANSENPAEAVHDARRHLKKLQALIRLVRPTIGEDAFVRERGRFRRAAQRLSSARDAEVSVLTLKRLEDSADGETQPALKSALDAFATVFSHHRAPPQRTLDAVGASLVEASGAVREWTCAGESMEALGDGVENLYRRARKAGAAAEETPTTEHLHKWRRATKELWSALRLLRRRDDKRLRKMAEAAYTLSELLGDDHDLATLEDALTSERMAATLGTEAVNAISQLIAAERSRLQRKAWTLGKELYEKKPRKVRKRVREL